MNEAREHPLIALLLAIARVAPQPWYLRHYVDQTGVDATALDELVEWLYLEGMIQKAAPVENMPAGIELTERGKQLISDPAAQDRLRKGEPISSTQGAIVRNSLLLRSNPIVTRALLIANFLVFGYCLYLAHQSNVMRSYLPGLGAGANVVTQVLHPAGGVSALDLIQGSWWRLLTSCFVHAGLLHLAMNMYALHGVGRMVEQTWGRWRYALIYAIAGWGGSCLGLAYHPVAHGQVITQIGASGALCGVLAAEAVWILLNGRHLPRSMAQRGRSQMMTTVILMVLISLIPGVSGWGHLGGALAGGAVALILHLQRFGGRVLFWVAGPLVVLVPVASWQHLGRERATQAAWQKLQGEAAKTEVAKPTGDVMDRVLKLCEKDLQDLRENYHFSRRDPKKVKVLQSAFEKQKRETAKALKQVEQFQGGAGEVGEEQKRALEGLKATAELCDQALKYLQADEQTEKKEWTALKKLFDKVVEYDEERKERPKKQDKDKEKD